MLRSGCLDGETVSLPPHADLMDPGGRPDLRLQVLGEPEV